MDIIRNNLIASFESVARIGTVHGAARELRLTQTAVTKRIRHLEDGLGVALFLRSRRGMTLTTEGKMLLQYSRATLALEGQLLSQFDGSTYHEVSLTIVGPTSAISTRIAEDCEPIYKKFPHLNLNLESDDHSDLFELLKTGKADLAVVPPFNIPNEMDSKVLKSDRYILVGPPQWKSRNLREILEKERMIDFYEPDMTTRSYLKKYRLEKFVKRSRLFINENEAMLKMFIAGVGYGTLTEAVAQPFLTSGKLICLNGGRAMEDPLALVWYPRAHRPDYFDHVIRSIK